MLTRLYAVCKIIIIIIGCCDNFHTSTEFSQPWQSTHICLHLFPRGKFRGNDSDSPSFSHRGTNKGSQTLNMITVPVLLYCQTGCAELRSDSQVFIV